MTQDNEHVFNPKDAWALSSKFRSWLQPPTKMLNGFIKPGMNVMDFGCGSGFLTTTIANKVGVGAKVYAVDLQKEMLKHLEESIKDTAIEKRIVIHQCKSDCIGLDVDVDAVIAFYVVHEVPNQKATVSEFYKNLNSGGVFYMVEPKFHVNKHKFNAQIKLAEAAGFKLKELPKVRMSHAALFEKE